MKLSTFLIMLAGGLGLILAFVAFDMHQKNYSTAKLTGIMSLVYFAAIPIILFFRFRTAKIDREKTEKDFSEVRIFADQPLEEVQPNRLLNRVQGAVLKYHALTHALLAGAMLCVFATQLGEFQGKPWLFETDATWTCLGVALFLVWLLTNALIYFIGSMKNEVFMDEAVENEVPENALKLYESIETDSFGKTMTLLGDLKVQHTGTHYERYYLPEVPLAVAEVAIVLGKPVIGFTSITLEGVAITTGNVGELLDYRELGIPSVRACFPSELESLEEKYRYHMHIVQQVVSDKYSMPLLISPSHVAHVFEYTHRLANWVKYKTAFATGRKPKLLPSRGEIATKINDLWWFNWSVRSDLRKIFADIKLDRTQFHISAEQETETAAPPQLAEGRP